MLQLRSPAAATATPLVLCDHLLSLAQEADRAGHLGTATQLVHLAYAVFDEAKTPALA